MPFFLYSNTVITVIVLYLQLIWDREKRKYLIMTIKGLFDLRNALDALITATALKAFMQIWYK